MTSPTPVVTFAPEVITARPRKKTSVPAPKIRLTNRAAGRLKAEGARPDTGLASRRYVPTDQDTADVPAASAPLYHTEPTAAEKTRATAMAAAAKATPSDTGLASTGYVLTDQDTADVPAASAPLYHTEPTAAEKTRATAMAAAAKAAPEDTGLASASYQLTAQDRSEAASALAPGRSTGAVAPEPARAAIVPPTIDGPRPSGAEGPALAGALAASFGPETDLDLRTAPDVTAAPGAAPPATAVPQIGTEPGAPATDEPETVEQWQSQVQRDTAALPHPTLALSGKNALLAVAGNAAKRGMRARADVTAGTTQLVPPHPRVPEPPGPPPDPVPEASALVTDASLKSLPDLVLPALVATPMGRKTVLDPPPRPPAALRETEPATKAGPVKKPSVTRDPVATAPPAAQPVPEVPTLQDIRAPVVLTLPPPIALKIGQVIRQLRADVPAVACRALAGARQASYQGGALKSYFPELDKPLEPELTTALSLALDKIAEVSGLSQAQLDEAVTRRREELAATSTAAVTDQQQSAQDTAKKVQSEADKTAATISRERDKAALETHDRMRRAMTSTKPEFITDVRDEILGRLRKEVTRGAAGHRRAAERRVEQISYYEARYTDAYRKADNADLKSVYAAGRGIASINLDEVTGRPWLDVRLEEVAAAMAELRKQATEAGEGMAKAIEEQAGSQAYDLVREWAASRLGQIRDDDTKRIEGARDLDAQSRRRVEAEAEVRAAENRDSLLSDLSLLQMIDEREAEAAGRKVQANADRLDDMQFAEAKKYFGFDTGPRNPIAALAEKVNARVTQERRTDLVAKLREGVEGRDGVGGIDPYTLDAEGKRQLCAVLFADDMVAAEVISKKVMAAMEGLGTDEDAIYKALGGLTPTQAKVVRATFQELHPDRWTLDEALEDEMSGSELQRARGLAAGDKIAASAAAIFDAIDGLGTDEELVYTTLRNLSKDELEQVKAYYLRTYHESLEEALRGDFSDKELARAEALAAGDKSKADAYAVDESLRGSIWGPDRKGLEQVHQQIRDEIAAANPDMKSDELDMEVRRRTGELEASYQKFPGEGQTLKDAYGKYLTGPTKDLAIALVDNDLDGADAARSKIEAQAAQESGRNADDALIAIVKARNERMLDKVRRDKGPALYQEFAKQIDDRKRAGNPMTPWEREKAERDIQVRLRQLGDEASQAGMSTLESRFDEKYQGVFTRYAPGGQPIDSKTGGFAAMRDMLITGPEAKDWFKKGYLTLAEQVRYSVEGIGTDEDRLKEATKGRTKAELEEAREQYRERWHEDMDERIRDELDAGTRDRFDVEENLRGAPETPDEMMAAAKRRYEYETTTYGVSGTMLDPATRKLLEQDYQTLQAKMAKLTDPSHKPSGEELDRLYGEFSGSRRSFESSADLYRKSVDALVDTVTQIVGAVVAITVAVVLTIATAGTAAPAMIALAASLWGTTATIATKMLLLGKAYGMEDLGKDLALGAVDAAVAVATAGLGDKLLKAAKGAASPGTLARMAASGSKAAQMSAKAAAHVIELAAQSAPNALAATLLDDSTYRGDVFTNIVRDTVHGTAMNIAVGFGIGTVTHVGGKMVGAVRAEVNLLRGKPPPEAVAIIESSVTRATEQASQPGRPADVLELRGTPHERAAAYRDFRREYPGATYKEFLRALDNGSTSIQAHPDTAAQIQRMMRRELMEAIPTELRGRFAGTPIEVVSDAQFEAFGRSRTGQAIVVIEHGEPRVLVREGAPPGVLKEEGIHLWQSADPETATMVARLDEAKLGKWDSLTIGEKVELYKNKIALELDAQQRIEAELRRRIEDESIPWEQRADFVSDLEASRRTSEILGERLGEVHDLVPADLAAITDGRQKLPQYLDQPARLFNKAYAYGDVSIREITPLGEEGGVRKYLVGESYRARTPGGSVRRLRNIIVVEPGKPPRLVVEVFRTDKVWAQHGTLNVYEGQVGEAASRYVSEQEAVKAALEGKLHVPVAVQTPTGAGFDQVILVFEKNAAGKDTARILILEAKNYNNRYVPREDITAINDNFRDNRNALRRKLLAYDAAEKLGITQDQVDAALEAITEGKFDLQLRTGPTTGIGTLESGSILKKLQARLRQGYGEEVRVLDPHQMTEADIAEGRKRVAKFEGFPTRFADRVAQLAVTPAGISAETLRQAHAVAQAEATGILAKPVSRSSVPDRFYDGLSRPVDAVRLARARFDPATTAADVLDRLNRSDFLSGSKVQQDAVRVVLDADELTRAQQRDLMRELYRQAADRSMTHALKTRLAPLVSAPAPEK